MRWPVRKLARVGRPSQPPGQERPHLGGRELGAARRRRSLATSSSSTRWSSARCQRSRLPVAVSASAASAIASAHSASVWRALSERRPPAPTRVDQLGEAPGQVDGAAVDVIEREHAGEQPLAVLGHRHPQQQPLQAGLPGAAVERVELVGSAMRGVEAPADARLGDPVGQPGDVIVVEAEAAAHGAAVGEVEHLRGGEPLLGELEQLGDDAEHRVGLAQRAVGEPHAQVDRPGRRRCRVVAGVAGPKVAWISGANVSMSGHITITSRGSSVGSSASACRIASRITSTWRARPWQEWISMLRSSAASSGRSSAAPGSGAPGAAWSSRTPCWMRPSRVPGAGGEGWPASESSGAAAVRTSCISRESRPQEASSRLAARVTVRSSLPARDGRAVRAMCHLLPQRRRRV